MRCCTFALIFTAAAAVPAEEAVLLGSRDSRGTDHNQDSRRAGPQEAGDLQVGAGPSDLRAAEVGSLRIGRRKEGSPDSAVDTLAGERHPGAEGRTDRTDPGAGTLAVEAGIGQAVGRKETGDSGLADGSRDIHREREDSH